MQHTTTPAYLTGLIRHFEDLRDGTHGGSARREDKEAHFEKAVQLLAPVACQVLSEMNTSLRDRRCTARESARGLTAASKPGTIETTAEYTRSSHENSACIGQEMVTASRHARRGAVVRESRAD
jgi:hypothetical protein